MIFKKKLSDFVWRQLRTQPTSAPSVVGIKKSFCSVISFEKFLIFQNCVF